MTEWTYLAQRLPGGAFLDFDLPLTAVEVTEARNAPGGLTATVPVEVGRLAGGRVAAERAMLAAAGKRELVESDTPPPPDDGVLWLDGQRTPHVYVTVPLDGGPVVAAHTVGASSPAPGEGAALDVDGGRP